MGTPLSIAVCSNRPENMANVAHLVDCASGDDEVILIVDIEHGGVDPTMLDGLSARGVRVIGNGANRGLSFSRNRALRECRHRHLVYVDDDIVLTSATIEAIRVAVSDGAGIVGVWLQPVFESPVPWWLTGGQYHYLGVHHAPVQAKTWGACMAVDTELAARIGLTFRDELGRRGNGLQSGDDTSFLVDLRAAGAEERFLPESVAVHRVTRSRTRFAYLLRRAWWQGRSEVRRSVARAAIGKEWRRGLVRGPASPSIARRYLLACVYLAAVVAGIATESLIRAGRFASQ